MRSLRTIGLGALLFALVARSVAASPPEVSIRHPGALRAVFGEIDVVADVYAAEGTVDRVDFFVDDRLLGSVDAPPYRMVVDVGQDNVQHLFEVVVHHVDGTQARDSVLTPRIATNMELTVELVQLYATVSRSGDRPGELRRDDFRVLDNGIPQELVTFELGDVPFTAVLLLDASSSMSGADLKTAIDCARDFSRALDPLDEIKLLLFSDRLLGETPFTGLESVLDVSLQGLVAGGGTAINDSLYLALKRLERRKGRKVAVILSDGVDVESVVSMEQVQWLARRQDAMLFWIQLGRSGLSVAQGREASTWRDARGHQEQLRLLRQTVVESGGRVERIESMDQVSGVLGGILSELRDQYVLGYYPPRVREGSWHEVRVRVRGGGRVNTRRGYLE